jgi:hypothetical protein
MEVAKASMARPKAMAIKEIQACIGLYCRVFREKGKHFRFFFKEKDGKTAPLS